MPIAVRCPHCGRGYNARDELAGRQVKCQCGQVLSVPASPPPADPLSQLAALEAASLAASPVGRPPGSSRLALRTGRKQARKPAFSGAVIAAIGGGAVVLLLLVGVMVSFSVRSRGSGQDQLGAAASQASASSPGAGPAAANQQASAAGAAAPAGPATLANYSGIYCFAVSNDATRIATYAHEKGTSGIVPTLKLWDLQTGQPIASMPGPKSEHSIVLSPACDHLATREAIWSTATGTLRHQLDGLAHRVIGFSQDGNTLILWNGIDEAATVDVATGQVQKTKYGPQSILMLEGILSPTEPMLVVCKVYRAATPQGEMRSFATVEFHRLGVVEKTPGREMSEIPHQLAFSRDGSLIACALGGGTITVRDPKLWTERYTMTRPTPTGGEKFTQFNDLALSPSGTFIAVIASVTAADRRIDARLELWNLETRQITPVLDGRPEQVVFLPDGKLVAAERNGSLKFFDPAGRPMPPPGSTGR